MYLTLNQIPVKSRGDVDWKMFTDVRTNQFYVLGLAASSTDGAYTSRLDVAEIAFMDN